MSFGTLKKLYYYKNNSTTDKKYHNILIYSIKQNSEYCAVTYFSGTKSRLILQYNFKTRCNGSIDN